MFNLLFDHGIFTEQWIGGMIKPIYKGKGNNKEPERYRPNSPISCPGTRFTSILNNRIYEFFDSNNFVTDSQAGDPPPFKTSVVCCYVVGIKVICEKIWIFWTNLFLKVLDLPMDIWI